MNRGKQKVQNNIFDIVTDAANKFTAEQTAETDYVRGNLLDVMWYTSTASSRAHICTFAESCIIRPVTHPKIKQADQLCSTNTNG